MKFVNNIIEFSKEEVIMNFNIGEKDICNFAFGELIVLYIDREESQSLLDATDENVKTMLNIYKDLPTIFDLVNVLNAEKISYKINRYRDGVELDMDSVKEYVKPVEEVKEEPEPIKVENTEDRVTIKEEVAIEETKKEEPEDNKPTSKYNFDINDEDFESKPKGKKNNKKFNKNINNNHQRPNNNNNQRFNNNNNNRPDVNRETGRPLSRCEQMEAMRKTYVNGSQQQNQSIRRPYQADEVMRKYQNESLNKMTTDKMRPDERFTDIMKHQKEKEKFNKEYQDRMVDRYNSMMKYIK